VGPKQRLRYNEGDTVPGRDDAIADEFVPDPQVCREFHITSMTLWRWDHDAELDFPPPIKIRKKNYRSRLLSEQFKRRMVADSIAARGRQ
jgi:hypothetical protein